MNRSLIFVVAVAAAGCAPDLDVTRQADQRGTFGDTVYREACQRVALTAQLDEQAAGQRDVIDVNGSVYGSVCTQNAPAPDDAPQKLKALQAQHNKLVAAVNLILPDSFLDPMEAFLEALTALADDGTMEALIGNTGDMLGRLKDDQQFTTALSHFSSRTGYRPFKTGDLLRTVVDYPQLDDVLAKSLDLLIDDSGQLTPELLNLLTALTKEMSTATPVAVPSDGTRTLAIARDLLLTTSDDFGSGTPRLMTRRDWRGVAQIPTNPDGSLPAPFVDNNGDGLADIDSFGHFVGADGNPVPLASPFAQQGDKATRDPDGRLIDGGGNPIYDYVDLDPTFIGAVTGEAVSLLDPTQDNALGMVHGAAALLGPRTMVTKQYVDANKMPSSLAYMGFNTDDSSLLDLLHAFVQILGDPNAQDTLLATRTLLTQHEDEVTRVIAAAFDANDRGKMHPEAMIPATSDLYDDLVPIIIRVLRIPGLAADLMDALEDPHTRALAPMFAREMLYTDRFILDQDTQYVSGDFVTPVDYGQPDSDWNRSILQRKMHLVRDADGAQFCNKDHATATVLGISLGDYSKCSMFEVDDLGLFFVLAIADHSITDDPNRPDTRHAASFREQMTDSTLRGLVPDSGLGDTILETLTGISGFGRFPTPEAASRALFLDHDHQSSFMQGSTDPVQCVDGDNFIDVHNDTIFAWEATLPNNPSGYPNDNFYDAVKPLVNAFARHDECIASDGNGSCTRVQNAAKIFVDLMKVLHTHWASAQSTYFGKGFQSKDPNLPRYSAGDGVFTYQKLVGEVLGPQGDLVPSIQALGPVLRTMTLDGTGNTPPARPSLLATFGYLFDPAQAPPGLSYRDGRITTKKSDGVSPGPHVTPYYLLADAYAEKRAALDAAPPDRAGAWRSATSNLVDQALTIETLNGLHQMKNRHFHGITVNLIDFLRGRIAAHAAAGDLAQWTHEDLTGDVTKVVAGPCFAALADLTAKLESNDAAKTSLYGLLNYLVNRAQSDTTFQTALTALADDVQIFLDDPDTVPIAHALGTALDPSSGAVNAQLRMMQRSHQVDPNCPKSGGKGACTLVTLLRNMYQATPAGGSPATDVVDSLAAVNRSAPGATGNYSPDDYASILGNIQTFLTDNDRGFIRFVNIVKSRRYNP
jgi:hypothetical protein